MIIVEENSLHIRFIFSTNIDKEMVNHCEYNVQCSNVHAIILRNLYETGFAILTPYPKLQINQSINQSMNI